jgi:oligopeptidase A
LSISGIAHVPWDAVEVCSQFLENYCWDENIIRSLSSHIETNKSLPDDLIEKLLEARKFNGALGVLRQVQFGIFDLSLHINNNNNKSVLNISEKLNQARSKYGIYKFKDYDRFQHAFSHIFAGGYAAGYYSYLWAEMISCHLFNKVNNIGSVAIRESFYEKGGAIDPADLFVLCCGEKADISYLLSDYGI